MYKYSREKASVMNVHAITYLVTSCLGFDTGTLGLKEEVKVNFITRNSNLFVEASNDVISVIWSLEGIFFRNLLCYKQGVIIHISH